MALVTTQQMLLNAQKGGYAIGAFNVENMEMAQAVVAAAEEMKAPVILQTTSSTLKYAPPAVFYSMVRALAESSSIPVAIHLDHGSSYELAVKALRAGYTSIMIDGSHESFENNIAVSKKVVQMCKQAGVPVEGELGKVGGKEDDVESDGPGYTDPDEARLFVDETGISSLAIGVGTSHGIYSGEPVVDIERVGLIREKVSVPLVLHGTSGVPDKTVQACVQQGICKVNYATELRIAFSDGVKSVLNENPDVFDPKAYLAPGRQNVEDIVRLRIAVCGSEGKAVR